MATTTLTVDGSAVAIGENNAWPTRLTMRLKGIGSLTIVRTGGKLVGTPDPWLGKKVELAIDGTTYFKGDVVDAVPIYNNFGWVVSYQCLDLRNRGDRVPFTDSNSQTDSAVWNLASDDLRWQADRVGKTVGEILTDALTMEANATALDALGIGGYATLTPAPALHADTIADLALLTTVPPTASYIQGEKLLSAIESFVSAWAPNHALWIRPSDGAFRFIDLRNMTEHEFTMEVDPIEPTPLARSVGDCYQRVLVRGMPIAEPKVVSLASGGLVEDFAWGPYATSADAKAAWTPDDNDEDVQARSLGTCACTDTTNVVLTSNPTTQTWAEDDWDQTNRMGVLYLWYSAGSGINQFVGRRVAANAAKASGGTSNFVLDIALPATNYDKYVLYGISTGAALVYKKYKVVDPDVAAAMARLLTYPVPWVGANGDIAMMTSTPMGSAIWSTDGNPPYIERTIPFTFSPSTGEIIFAKPTYKAVGGHDPTDVRVLLAVNTGVLTAVAPSSGHEGTSHSVEGMSDTLTVTVRSWRDPINQAAMEAYAQDLLDSVKDTVVEGEIVYHGLFAGALTFGLGASVTGSSYTTGWEGLNLPIVAVDLEWNSGAASHYTTTMHVSNRRAHLTTDSFMKPDRPVGGAEVGIAEAEGNAAEYRSAFGGDQADTLQRDAKANGIAGKTATAGGSDV